jgi:hypothetical protein
VGIELWFDQSGLRGGDAWDRQRSRPLLRGHEVAEDCALKSTTLHFAAQSQEAIKIRRAWPSRHKEPRGHGSLIEIGVVTAPLLGHGHIQDGWIVQRNDAQ